MEFYIGRGEAHTVDPKDLHAVAFGNHASVLASGDPLDITQTNVSGSAFVIDGLDHDAFFL